MRRPVRAIFAWPMVLGLASLSGLILGLVGEGLPDNISWTLLGAVPVTITAAWLRRTRNISPARGHDHL